MNIKTVFCSLAVLFLISCDNETSSLGSSITPQGDQMSVISDSCFATSRTIRANDSILVLTQLYDLGRFTEQQSGAKFEAGILTQVNCPENCNLPDSAYGLSQFHFPQWFIDKVGDQKPYYANLKLYFAGFFGDSTNIIKIDVFPLNKMLDGNTRYYTDIDPAEFCDLDAEPLASMTASAYNLQNSDSVLSIKNRDAFIQIRLPDSVAQNILETYYDPEGRKYFSDAATFMEHFYKGFYIRCTQGDGTVLYINGISLEVNIKSIILDKKGEPAYSSIMADFAGNSEVMQLNCIRWEGLDGQISDNTGTWIRTPFGLLTEITLPVDKMKKENTVLNSAYLCLSSAVTPSRRFKPSAPSILALIRKDRVQDFFSKNNNIDNIESFATSYSTKLGTYTFNNLGPLVEKAYSDREKWLNENGMSLDDAGRLAYATAFPNWDKVVLIPVTARMASNNTVSSYQLDMRMHQVKLIGGAADSIKIKIIRSQL